MKLYTTVPGDTPSSAAKRFGLDTAELCRVNGLTDTSRLTPGLSLLIPEDIPSPSVPGEIFGFASGHAGEDDLGCCTYYSVGTYSFTPDGALLESMPSQNSSEVKNASVLPIITLANTDRGGFDPELSHSILSSPDRSGALLSAAAMQAERLGCMGINLFFQYLFPFDIRDYCTFISLASQMLHGRGMYLFVSTKTAEESPDFAPVMSAAGEAADRVIILPPRQISEFSPPGVPLPIGFLRRNIDSALGQIPGGRLLMGLPVRGYNWGLPKTRDTGAASVSPLCAANMAVSLGAGISYDAMTECPSFSYTDILGQKHTVFFENNRSLKQKLLLPSDFGLAGAAVWGSVDDSVFTLISRLYDVEKLI